MVSPEPIGTPEGEPVPPSSRAEPVAVVWCRQVDNEAESPGYTALPNDFPGYPETMEAIRIVGNLAINVADTHDYWDPDPALPLSYYRNLFLYPAFGGTYTCLGRMFLSTEDRPRLGMKTLVLATGRLLASPGYGETLLRWYESMGGRPGHRLPPPTDPRLYPLVGEGFLFHRGSTEPVVLIAGDEWEATMETIFDYLRGLPAALLSLGAILAFPYFLPEPKVNLTDFAESVPLVLAVMRVPKGEATGERHRKRIHSWQDAPVVLYDLTAGTGSLLAKGRETAPLIAQYVRDHAQSKLAPVAERVDRVELRTLRARLADPDRQAGKDRRKEIWRLSTAMESAALLLQKPRGRRLDLSADLSRRAQEYVRAHAGGETAEENEAPPVAVPAPLVEPDPHVAGQPPPWLQRPGGPVPAAVQRTARVEVVPVSVKDDPSLLRTPEPARREPASAANRLPRPAESFPMSPFPPEFEARLKRQIEADLVRFVDERLSGATTAATAQSTRAVEDRIGARISSLEQKLNAAAPRGPPPPPPVDLRQVDQLVQERIKTNLADQATRQSEALRDARTGLERRFAEWSGGEHQALGSVTDRLLARAAELEARVTQQSTAQIAQSEERIRGEIRAILTEEFDRGVRAVVEPRVQDLRTRVDEALQKAAKEIQAQLTAAASRTLADLEARTRGTEENLRGALAAQLDLHLREAQDREESARTEIEERFQGLIDKRLADAEQKRSKDLQEAERRLALLVDGRAREVQERVQTALKDAEMRALGLLEEQLQGLESRADRRVDSKIEEARDAEVHALADLQVRLQSYAEQKVKEAQDREREKYLELLARLKGETETALARVPDATAVERIVKDLFQRGSEAVKNDLQRLIDLRAMAVEERYGREHTEVVQRLEAIRSTVEDRGRESIRLEDAIRAELDEIDRKIEVLTDRLVPVVRKAWVRISELERGTGESPDTELKYAQLRREFTQDLRRLETDLTDRTREIRERVEGTIANQGRVWLTLVRQLSQMTEDRRAAGELAPSPSARAREPRERDTIDRELDQLASLSRSAARGEEETDVPDPEAAGRRRSRRSPTR